MRRGSDVLVVLTVSLLFGTLLGQLWLLYLYQGHSIVFGVAVVAAAIAGCAVLLVRRLVSRSHRIGPPSMRARHRCTRSDAIHTFRAEGAYQVVEATIGGRRARDVRSWVASSDTERCPQTIVEVHWTPPVSQIGEVVEICVWLERI